ncbi:zinc finger BED domain-containing protein RICESLEEPER [Trifolium repens]|nr:zinc finger BED domain-containing protein RICESLEEPER [Trifolium repens]
MCNSEDEKLKFMALKMKMKYDKYWGNPDRLNMLLLIAMVLDPQCKMKLVVWLTTRIYGSAQTESLKTKLDAYLKSMYDEYSGRVVSRLGSSSNLASAFNGDPHEIAEFYESEQCSTSETEMAKYNRLDVEERRPDFDLLEWWKVNTSQFPILASIARDVLAIPITIVASESTFSTGGKDP